MKHSIKGGPTCDIEDKTRHIRPARRPWASKKARIATHTRRLFQYTNKPFFIITQSNPRKCPRRTTHDMMVVDLTRMEAGAII